LRRPRPEDALDFRPGREKIVVAMLSWRRITGLWSLVLACGAPAPGAAVAAEREPVALVLLGVDAFSRRPAEELAERLEPGLSAAPGLRLVPLDRPEGDPRWRQALQELEAGREAYLDMEPEPAAARLRQALDLMLQAGDTLVQSGRPAFLDGLLTLGAVETLGGDPARGQATFARALVYEPGAALDAATFPPELVHAFSTVRAGVAARPRGSLSVFTTPDLARVWVDGRFQGVTPCEVGGLVAGPHQVWLRRLGHAGAGGLVEVEGGARAEWSLRLAPAPGAVELADALDEAVRALPLGGARALTAWAARQGLRWVLVGRLSQAGAGFALQTAWLEVGSGRFLGARQAGLAAVPAAGSADLRALLSSLLSREGGVLESLPPEAALPGQVELQDEARFQEQERPWWKRWEVWTGIGAGLVVVAGAIVLGVLLAGDDGPGSQIVLEF